MSLLQKPFFLKLCFDFKYKVTIMYFLLKQYVPSVLILTVKQNISGMCHISGIRPRYDVR